MIVIQGIASSLFWLGLAQLGNPSSKRRSGDTEEVRLASEGWLPHPGQADLRRQGEEISLTEDVLPSLLTRNSVLQQILINTVLVSSKIEFLFPIESPSIIENFQTSSFLSFWYVMDLLA